jgi:hypothetical protein
MSKKFPAQLHVSQAVASAGDHRLDGGENVDPMNEVVVGKSCIGEVPASSMNSTACDPVADEMFALGRRLQKGKTPERFRHPGSSWLTWWRWVPVTG